MASRNVTSQSAAIQVHHEVGQEVREAISKIGGTMPEAIPPAEHIKVVKKRIKSAKPKLQLDDRDAKGLKPQPTVEDTFDDLRS